tara:strand:+ start:673 stop:1722 length:1050 start_codon:yes stop_codon:yes gene_type:complete
MTKIKLGIVGCGAISQLNVPGYLENSNCEIVSLCDTQYERAESRSNQWGINPQIFTNFDEFISNTEMDAIEILTPTFLHSEQIIKALNSNKHVSCQKPLSTTLDEAKRINSAVKKSTSKFRITENYLYYPPIIKAKQLINDGAIGEPNMIRIRHLRGKSSNSYKLENDTNIWRRDSNKNPGGGLYDGGWHHYATAVNLVGEISKISAFVSKNEDFIDETPSSTIFEVKNKKCLVSIDYASSPEMYLRSKYYSVDEFFEIIGSEGTIWITRCTGEMLDLPPLIVFNGDKSTHHQIDSDWISGFKGAAHAFIDSINNDSHIDMDIDFSTHVLKIALGVYESSNTHQTVTIS